MNVLFQPLLHLSDVHVAFTRRNTSHLPALESISFTVEQGEIMCLVGESGCGKSLTARSIMGLLPQSAAKVVQGEIRFQGTNLVNVPEKVMNSIRGHHMAMIFQDPMTALNPVLQVGIQAMEPLVRHKHMSKTDAKKAILALFEQVGFPDPVQAFGQYPHEMSGGMCQRALIAQAITCGPSLLLADEPTTALDVTIQKQILLLLRQLVRQAGMGLLLITHDFAVVAEMADSVAVMYAGHIVESGAATAVLTNPRHPYTLGLLHSRPGKAISEQVQHAEPQAHQRFIAIPGSVPPLTQRPNGCPFHPRCPNAIPRCAVEKPFSTNIKNPLIPSQQSTQYSKVHTVSCWNQCS